MTYKNIVWHSETKDSVIKILESSENGLKNSDAVHRLHTYGPNILTKRKEISKIKLFLSQFNSFIIWILIVATILSFIIGDKVDAYVILAIVIINAILGYYQEHNAAKSLEALKRMAALQAVVVRNGSIIKTDSEKLVPGDIILLEAGNKVPADSRIIQATRLEVDESSLTGESTLVPKSEKQIKEETFLSDRCNMAYAGTIVVKGCARAIVVETGMKTELGKIAALVEGEKDSETPLQKKISVFGEFLGIGIIAVCAVVFLIGILRETGNISQIFMISISLAVAAIPEGLPAVVTICLAIGVQKMVKKHALIRKLPSVETLGETDVICTDKTGTLTYNQMTVREIYANSKAYFVSGQGYSPNGYFTDEKNGNADTKEIAILLKCSVLCNDSSLDRDHKGWKIIGDPTEGALVVAAAKAGFHKEDLEKSSKRIDTIAFDSDRKRMSTLNKEGTKVYGYVKGAPDIILPLCKKIYINGKIRNITETDRKEIISQNFNMANKALRVLGFAYKEIDNSGVKYKEEKEIENNLIFLGIIGMNDPPRKEVIGSIKQCNDAGIRVIMITGDHKATAVAIAHELGLGTNVLTGEELDKIEDLSKIVDSVEIYARVSAEHKLKIVAALRERGHVVAMTGDGVNDAPALKSADIGIAMGITGTDVSKETADMVLTDDNFTSIVNAVEEGRTIYDNIRKFIRYLITSNLGKILLLFIAMLVGYQSVKTGDIILPLLAIQILWINLLTDGLPALALSVEKADKDIMKRKPRKKGERIVTTALVMDTFIVGIVMCLGSLFLFVYGLKYSDYYAQTLAFTVIVMFKLFNVFNSRSEKGSVISGNLFTNKWLWLSVGFSFALQLLIIYTPLSQIFKTVRLGFMDWAIVFAVAFSVIVVMEIKKLIVRMLDKEKENAPEKNKSSVPI
jgi:P-type Ca2+ transporter type 2C